MCYLSDMNNEKLTIEKKSATKASAGRFFFAAIAVIVEFLFIVIIATYLSVYAQWISLITRGFSLFLVLLIYSRYQTASLKTPWIILILVLPIVGVTMYLLVEFAGTPAQMQRRLDAIDDTLFPLICEDEARSNDLALTRQYDPHLSDISRYLQKKASFPVYTDSSISYYPDASLALQAMLKDLQNAEKFIFMEYHAIENAESWLIIQDILAAKVKAGVEVRVFYDDVGSIFFLNRDFRKQLQSLGIQCRVFNPVVPFMKLILNNRDHRKITVIDGKIGYTGGFNLANEYFNLTHPYGHWKDTGVRIEGDAVNSLTVMFLEMWNTMRSNDLDDLTVDHYLIKQDASAVSREESSSSISDEENSTDASSEGSSSKNDLPCFIQPYGDVPTDHEQVGENVYIAMIEQAVDYIYFSTPYLVITDEMAHALGLAAKRGVDVRIMTPGIPDKKIIYELTRSYYHVLVRNGVRIYEYTPGFNHAKVCVADDRAAVVGTINMDFRSLYHHFEDAVLFYNCPQVMDVKNDLLKTFPLCQDVTEQYLTGRSTSMRFRQLVLRVFAPLL